MSWLVPSACFDYLWLYSFFAPVPLPHFISLSVLSCLSHSAHIQKSPTGVHACVFVWLLVCACSSHGLFSSSLWLHIACFITTVGSCTSSCRCTLQKSITPDQEAEVRALTVGREWDFHAYCNPGDFAEHWTTTASHVKFSGWDAFLFSCSVCDVTRNGELAKCVFETFHPHPLFSTVTLQMIKEASGLQREREGMFEVFHIDLIRQHNRTLKLHVSLLEYVTSILCFFSLKILSRGDAQSVCTIHWLINQLDSQTLIFNVILIHLFFFIFFFCSVTV